MRISFTFKKGIRWDFEFGFKTELWSSSYWFNIIKLYTYTDESGGEYVAYASLKFSSFKSPKYWFK